jgi:N-acetylmuramoyl-L-alanine amidase
MKIGWQQKKAEKPLDRLVIRQFAYFCRFFSTDLKLINGVMSYSNAKLNKVVNFSKWEKIVPFFLFLVFVAMTPPNSSKKFRRSIQTIVIDAGHGGHDPGCSSNGVKEKDITLKMAKALGDKITELMPDVKVIYTRKSDKFVELWERADIANRSNADLFISLHCNSHKNTTISGTETFAMGLHKAGENLDVAKRENDVLLLETDYQEKYDGFDPSSPESHIYFSLFQNAYMDQSIKLASKVENQISKVVNRPSRGVKQAGFVVLWKTGMPSILVEAGFLSNKKDREYLNSEEGLDEFTTSLSKAFAEYKNVFEGNPAASK